MIYGIIIIAFFVMKKRAYCFFMHLYSRNDDEKDIINRYRRNNRFTKNKFRAQALNDSGRAAEQSFGHTSL